MPAAGRARKRERHGSPVGYAANVSTNVDAIRRSRVAKPRANGLAVSYATSTRDGSDVKLASQLDCPGKGAALRSEPRASHVGCQKCVSRTDVQWVGSVGVTSMSDPADNLDNEVAVQLH